MAETNQKWNTGPDLYRRCRPLPDDVVLKLFTNESGSRILPAGRRLRVYEPGCGPGRILIPLAKSLPGWQFTGADRLPRMVEALQDRWTSEGLTNLEIVEANIEAHVPATHPDLVLVSSLLHFFEDWEGLLKHLMEMTAPGGVIVLIGEEADQYNLAMNRGAEALAGLPDPGLAAFWGRFRAICAEKDLPIPRLIEPGSRWDLENTQAAGTLKSAQWREAAREEIDWPEDWDVGLLIETIRGRAYSQLLELSEGDAQAVAAALAADPAYEDPRRSFPSRHLIVARFFEKPASA